MQFRADWLCYRPVSYEKRIAGMEHTVPPKVWQSHQLPTLFTPINSAEILNTKRLIVLIKVSEGSN